MKYSAADLPHQPKKTNDCELNQEILSLMGYKHDYRKSCSLVVLTAEQFILLFWM